MNPPRKVKCGKDFSIFPVLMSWHGSMQPSRDSQSVTIMALLSAAPACEIYFSPLAAIVMLSVATNFDAV